MSWYPVAEILALVNSAPDAATGWQCLRGLCRRHWPSPMWAQLRGIHPAEDVAGAALWLRTQLSASRAAGIAVRGLYLGLDTLNMKGSHGANVEIGGAVRCDPLDTEIEWVDELEWYGERHLIVGLRAMKAVYERAEWRPLYEPADYVLFLGYSGIVLAEAAARVRWPRRVLIVWGFHDGDLFCLGRGSRTSFVRLTMPGAGYSWLLESNQP